MRILHLGNLQVVPALRALGHDVRVASQLCPLLVSPGRPVDVRVLHREIAPDAEAFFMADTLGRQTLAYGVEELPIPRLYWAIDVHLNFFWQRHYARLFDLVLTAQKDYVALFEGDGVPARWLPWGIDPGLFRDHGLERSIDLAFVGVVDANRPKRAAAIAELRRRFGLVTYGEDAAHRLDESAMARVFGSARIVFNESVMGDVNFRTFEAMACGALLVTERTGNGLFDLFTPGEHLAVYEPDDLVAQVTHYLGAPQARERIGRAGARVVAARHTMAARMATVTDWLEAGVVRRDVVPRAGASFGVAAQLTIARGLSDPTATMRLAAERLQAAVLAACDSDAVLALADIMLYLGRDDGALALLATVRAAAVADPRAWLLAGEIERRRGRPSAARAIFLDGVAATPMPPSMRAEVVGALADVESADAWFALGLVLQSAGVLFEAGFVRHVDVGLPRTACDYLQRSLARAPGDRRVLERLAILLELAGRHEYARGYREAQVRAAPTDAELRRSAARTLRQSYAFVEAEHQERVARVLAGEEGLGGTPAEQGAAYREAGLAWLHAGHGAGAARALERAVWLLPALAEVQADAALAHVENADLTAAARHLERALASASEDSFRIASLLTLLRERVRDSAASDRAVAPLV